MDVYRGLYRPVQEFIAAHPLAKNKFKLDFDARIVATGLADQILKRINQGRKGSFSGVEEGQLVLKRLVDGADFDTEDGVIKFAVTLLDHFSYDHRVNPKVKVSIQDQLRGDKDDNQLVELLDAIFGLEW